MPSHAALPAITHLARKPCDARMPPGPNRHIDMRAATLGSLVVKRQACRRPALFRFMRCNIAFNLTNYYRKKRHRAEHRVAAFITDIRWHAHRARAEVRRPASQHPRKPASQQCDNRDAAVFTASQLSIRSAVASPDGRRLTLSLRCVNRQRVSPWPRVLAQTLPFSSAMTFQKRNIPLSHGTRSHVVFCPPPWPIRACGPMAYALPYRLAMKFAAARMVRWATATKLRRAHATWHTWASPEQRRGNRRALVGDAGRRAVRPA